MRGAEHVERMGERRGVYMVLVGIPEGKRPLWRPKRRWEDNIIKGDSVETTNKMQPCNRICYSTVH
jgi:hypothetical protein